MHMRHLTLSLIIVALTSSCSESQGTDKLTIFVLKSGCMERKTTRIRIDVGSAVNIWVDRRCSG